MKKILAALFAAIVMWLFAGRQISTFLDRYKTAETKSTPVHSVSYEGTGDGGVLIIDGGPLSLAPRNPHIGTSKDNQLALADSGKVFAFGASRSPGALATELSNGDTAVLAKRQSFFGWPAFNGDALRLNRNAYIQLNCTKQNGSTLKMTWVVEPHQAERLIRVEISDASR
jgi:hypothetical protein